MDRRQKKTRRAIFAAFSELLETKTFGSITVQEIIDRADVGRSTFYAHFETKDALLKEMCTDIFTHIFSDSLTTEKTHDFSSDGKGLEQKLIHILYHLRDSKKDVTGILSSESGELFMRYFKEYLKQLFEKYLKELKAKRNVPDEYFLNYLTGSFAETMRWWIGQEMEQTPEEIGRYYMEVICLCR